MDWLRTTLEMARVAREPPLGHGVAHAPPLWADAPPRLPPFYFYLFFNR
jgi:hypothetical protein